MKRRFLLLPALAATLMSCTVTAVHSPVSATQTQTYGVGCIPAINAVAAAVSGMPIPDPDFTGSQYRFAQRGSTELTLYARSRVNLRETWTAWTCVETGGRGTLSVKTSGLNALNANRLHQQFFSALNLPRP